MAWYNEEHPETLNYMVIGNCNAGHELLQASLTVHPKMVCHGDLLHIDEDIRRTEHEDYFGDSGKVPDWYQPKQLSVEQYLNNKIFDNTLFDEKAVGVKVDYSTFVKNDLWDFAAERCRVGDFCLLHVTRNPIACYFEYQGKLKQLGYSDSPFNRFNSISYLDPEELVTFVRDHLANEIKINRLCSDRAVIPYHELVLDFKGTLEQVCTFLGVQFSSACIPNRKRLKIQDIKGRIGNWTQLQAELPVDVKDVLNSPTLF